MSIFGSQNISSEVKIYHRKSTSGSQNVPPEVNFWKSKCSPGVDF